MLNKFFSKKFKVNKTNIFLFSFLLTQIAVPTFELFKPSSANANGTELGSGANSSGIRSTAIGEDSQATGDRSTAIGESSSATADRSTALGMGADATADRSTAIGEDSQACSWDIHWNCHC